MPKRPRFSKLTDLLPKLALVVCPFLFSACSYLGDAQGTKPQPVVLNAADANCFTTASQTLKDYFDHQTSLDAVNALADCSVRAVDEFTKKVVGPSNADSYSIDEINEFLSKYLEKQGSFDNDFTKLLFDLKASAIGGAANRISKTEITKIRSAIIDLKVSINEIDPFLEILTSRKTIDPKNSDDVAQLELTVTALNRAADRLSVYLQPNEARSQEFSNEQIIELAKRIGFESKIMPYKNLLNSGKSILLGGDNTGLRGDEWSNALKTLAKVYTAYLRYNNVLKPLPMANELALRSYHDVVSIAIDLLDNAVAAQPQNLISIKRLQALIVDLEAPDLLPFGLQVSSLNNFLPILLNKWLVDRVNVIPGSGGFGNPELGVLKAYAANWLYGYDVSMMALQPSGAVSLKGISAVNPMQTQVLKEFDLLFGSGRPFSYDANGYVYIDHAEKLPPLTLQKLVELNIKRVALEAGLRAYPTDLARAQNLSGLTEDETQQAYMDLKDIGKDVGFVDPRTPDAGNRTHMETNLFMSNSNGNDYLEFREGVEWFNIASSAAAQSDAIYKDISTQCPLYEKDVLGKQTIGVQCFRQMLHDNFAKYFANLPGMVAYVNDDLKSEDAWTAFLTPLEIASRAIGFSPKPMDSSSFRAMVTIMHYNESIMVRFDADKDQVLRDNELNTAFPMMRGYIQKLGSTAPNVAVIRGECQPEVTVPAPKGGPASIEFVQRWVFEYLILRGTPPPTGLWDRITKIPWADIESHFTKDKITRTEVAKLIASFTTFAKQTQQANIKFLLDTQGATLQSDLKGGTCSIVRKTMQVFRCDNGALPEFTAFMKDHADSIFKNAALASATSGSPGKILPVQFGLAVEQQLQADPKMKMECLPF